MLIDRVDLIFIPTIPLEIDLPQGTRFSINPIAPVSFLGSEGLQYPLAGLTLETGIAIGTSNTVTESRVSVTPEKTGAGDYMVVVPNTNLPHVIEWYTRQSPPSR